MTTLLLYPLLCVTFYYLGSRAVITSAIWSRYPRRLAAFMDCAACAGTWYGLLLASIGGLLLDFDFLTLNGRDPITWIIVGLCSTTWTPLIAALHQAALDRLGTAIADPEIPEEASSNSNRTP